jgi:hypothetical protein
MEALPTQIEPLFSERQYAAITGESLATARRNRLFRKGCPYVKLGARVLYRPADVRAYIERNLQSTKDSYLARRAGGKQAEVR